MRVSVVAVTVGLLIGGVVIGAAPSAAEDFDVDPIFSRYAIVISGESALAHFSDRLKNNGAVVQAWNLSARVSILPFGITRFRFLDSVFDGAFEVGVEPSFENFPTERVTFAGGGLYLRYYLLHFRYKRLVPWVDASIAPGWTNLQIGHVSNETRLSGPFMNLIQAGIGVSYFISPQAAIYVGLQAQHISNAGLDGSNDNFALNTAAGMVIGFSWYVKWPP